MKHTRGAELEGLLTTVFLTLEEVKTLTDNKADIEFLLSIVGSYIVAKKDGTLQEVHKTPSELFDDVVFPMLDEATLEVEEIADGE
jgi:hypothetical protein